MSDDPKRNRKLAAGASVSLLISLALYACLAGLLAFHYYAVSFLPHPDVIFSPSPVARLMNYLLGMAYAVPIICLWWLVVFLSARRRRLPRHRRFSRADLWLLLSVGLWALMLHAIAMGRFPVAYGDCGGATGFIALCAHPRWDYFWAVVGLAMALFLVGLVLRLKSTRPDPPLDLDNLRNGAIVAWIDPRPSERRLAQYLARLPVDLRGEVEHSARGLYAAVRAWLDGTETSDRDENPEAARAALEEHLEAGFPWLSKASLRRMWACFTWYS